MLKDIKVRIWGLELVFYPKCLETTLATDCVRLTLLIITVQTSGNFFDDNTKVYQNVVDIISNYKQTTGEIMSIQVLKATYYRGFRFRTNL